MLSEPFWRRSGLLALQLLPGLLVLSMVVQVSAQTTSPSAAGTTRPRMKVLNMEPRSTTGPKYYVIVGAVDLPGVFVAYDQSKLSLKDLLDAAGGMTSSASPAIRIVRDGTSTLQLFDPSQSTEQFFLQPNDIVVVVPHRELHAEANPHETVPIACVGLTNRPVVLPLSPEILTITDLVQRLGQDKALAKSVQVLDPYGRPDQELLLSGAVVVFDPATLNLASLGQIQEFNAAVPVNHRKMVSLQELEAEVSEGTSHADSNSARDIIIPPTPAPTIQVTGVVKPLISPPPRPVETLASKTTSPGNAASRELEVGSPLEATPMTGPPLEDPIAKTETTTQVEVAPPLPPLLSESARSSLAGVQKLSSESEASKTTEVFSFDRVLAMVLGAVVCLCVWMVVSRSHRRRSDDVQLVPVPVPDDTPSRTETLPVHSIREILDGSLKMVEEQVVFAHGKQLHSESIYLRRDPAQHPDGTHGQLQNEEAAESGLKSNEPLRISRTSQTLRDVEVQVSPVGTKTFTESALSPQQLTGPRSLHNSNVTSHSKFDVVTVSESAQTSDSPLERALRSLSESQSR